MSAEKRPVPNNFESSQIVKRQRSDADIGDGTVAVATGYGQNGALTKTTPRASSLHTPLMELTGHSGEVFSTRFDPTGQFLASGSMDRTIMLWKTSGACENYIQLQGHKGAVLDLHWSRDSRVLYTGSADMVAASWDVETGTRIRRHQGHDEIINCIDVTKRGDEVLITGSDDGFIGIWDVRQKNAIAFYDSSFPVTALAMTEAGNEIFAGGIANDINVWDIRKQDVAYSLLGHTDTVTSLEVSPDNQSLLSNSHDNSVRTWDIRPFAPADRQQDTYDGAPMGLEKNLYRASWDAEGKRIAAGSGDRTVVIWNVASKKITHKLPGHKGAVNDVRFSPTEPIIVSGSSDSTILLGELGK
ncbi:WD40 repeat-like protein [Aulographum hederae CBS 113979]|uniref:WD40 repeat-like protein n=1 Tax=Aulographum hederae CBS 113979 TaxID=1176131 RepID=A0A6G1GY04_9PEZI|nr:WD40 repeat-like protein [Aulographum hederae CBS 113979]